MEIDWNNPEQRANAIEIYYSMGYEVNCIPLPIQNGEVLPKEYVFSKADLVGDIENLPNIIDDVLQRITETAWIRVRWERDQLLKKTDVWAFPDRTMTQEQIDYRQALRDITNQEDPDNIVWPEKPL